MAQIIPFDSDLIPEAGALLAQRHARDRVVLAELPARFEDPATATAAVTTAWQQEGVSGVAALQDGRLAGHLIGRRVIDAVWGRSAWIRPAGCALAPDQDAELVRDLYAALAAPWVEQGIFFHFVLLPIAGRAMLDAWYSLSFGIEQVHALQSLAGLAPAAPARPPGLEIRQAGPADKAILIKLSDVIWRRQVPAPVWGIMLPELLPEQKEGWAELADDPDVTVWLAFLDGEPVGVQGYWTAEQAVDNLLIPPNCVHLSVAGTVEAFQGRGINTALTHHGLAQAAAAGYQVCETDWRSTNLLASRFWPRRGFRPMAYRLVRRIDPRIAWARGA